MTTTSDTERPDKTTTHADEENQYAQDSGWKALFGFTTRKHIPLLVASLITAFFAAITLPLFAVVYGLIFHAYTDYGAGKIESDKLLGNVTKYCIMLFGITSLSWITNSFCLFLFLTFGELQARSARNRIFEALLQKDMTWYDTQKTGIAALLPTIQTHIRDVQLSLSVPFAEAVQCIIQSSGALVVAFYYSWSLTLVIISTVPLIAVTQSFLDTRLSIRVQKHADKLQSVLKYFTSAIQNIETVKCLNGEKQELDSFIRLVTGAGSLYNRVANYRSMQIGVMQFSTLSVFFTAFWYGSHLVRVGHANIGQVITAFWAALMAIQGITGFIPQLIILQKGKVAAARLRKLMKPSLENDQGQESRPHPKSTHILGDIEFRQVTFSYPTRKDAKVLEGVSLSFPAQNTTFIVGKSGSGKSTLAQLLMRFYQPLSGKIYIDKVPLDKFDPRWIRKNITVVQQDSVLFNDTIRSNIAMGRERGFISPPVLQDAVSFAALELTMEELPDGLETHLGKRGDSLSGGQKQRIALARARVRDTPILVLDESTSALDYVTKAQVLSAIRKWRKGKTTIVITHDISQIRPDDYVVVLDHACLAQEGRRRDLDAQSGIFQSFLNARLDEGASGQTHDQRFSSSRHNRISTMSFSSVARRSVQRPLSSRLFGEDLFSPSEDTEEDLTDDVAREVEEELPAVPEPLPIMDIFRSVWPALDCRTRLLLLAAALCAVIHSAATPAFSWVFAQLLTSFYHPKDHQNRSRSYALSMLAIAVTDGLACYLMFFLSDVVAQSWAVQLKIEAMRRILQQPREFFDRKGNSISQLSETLDRYAEEARNLPGRFACVFLVVIFMIAISTIWSLISSWKLALVALIVSPVLYITTKCYNMISSRWEQRANEASGEVSEVFHETFTNIRTVRCLVLESHFRTKFTTTTTAAVRIGIKRALYSASFFGLNYSSVLFIAILLFWYGAVLISTNQFSVTRILEAFLVLILSMNHVVHMSNYITQVNMSRDAGSRLLRLARLPTTSHELDGTAQILRAGDINFHDVNFSYPTRPDHRVLKDISFSIRKGSCTAIVGSSGSGKSTIARLLLKLYKTDPQVFRAFQVPDISISSLNIQSLDTMILRSKISIVPQSPVLFPGTVAENITYGLGRFSPFSTTESIVTAARLAGVSDFIASLPQGYETLIGEGGTGLSGGQAQRIAIARALVRQPEILILDEATSALDAVSAGVVRDAVRALVGKGERNFSVGGLNSMRLRKETTVVIITHSKAWMELADHVIMMERGRVVEQGSYRELKSTRAGAFARLLRAEEGVAW